MKLFLPFLSSLYLGNLICSSATAQIIPDGTTSSTIGSTDIGIQIDGGDRAGSNLFHSFGEFSVSAGSEAFFNNADSVSHIFSRVTGGKISNIDGILRANGAANLFLINPAGIIFGEGASLQLGGSFYGSTADSIAFPDGEFSATDLDNPPLITINAPIGLNFREEPREIVNRSVANGVGLEVQTEKSLALVGGKLKLDGGRITIAEGAIELISIGDRGTVNLINNNLDFDFDFENITIFDDIELNQGAILSSRGGAISLQGNQISLTNSSLIISETSASVLGEPISIRAQELFLEDRAKIFTNINSNSNGSAIDIETAESIKIVGNGFEEFEQTIILDLFENNFSLENINTETGIFSATNGVGKAGEINLKTTQVNLSEGSSIGSLTLASGEAGGIKIDTRESLDLISSVIFVVPTLGSTGNGNTIEINTANLNISHSGLISSTNFGDGQGRDIIINASEDITLLETLPNSFISTGIYNNSFSSTGQAGNININTKKLSLYEGGNISSISGAITRFGIFPEGGKGGDINITATNFIEVSGVSSDNFFPSVITVATLTDNDAGNINIKTKNITVNRGGAINASTLGDGVGGNLAIEATESVVVSGTSPIRIFGSVNQFSSEISSESGIIGTIQNPFAQGNAGSLSISTDKLLMSDRGVVEVNSLGLGDAGTLNIFANSVSIDNRANISAATRSGDGGNINLEIEDTLRMKDRSFISAQALENANGGNINIDTDFIITYPSDGSGNDILASAEDGQGGNITITADALLGIEQRKAFPFNQTNDLDASSQFGLDGSVSINVPEVNYVKEATEVSSDFVNTELITVSSYCDSKNTDEISGLIFKGKGGVPPEIIETLNDDEIFTEETETIQLSPQEDANIDESFLHRHTNNLTPDYIPPYIKPVTYDKNGEPIYIARGLIVKQDGGIILTAYPIPETEYRFVKHTDDCN